MKRVVITKDRVNAVVGSINKLVGQQVLVGIPESTADRSDEDQGPINNATLGYIHEFGAPGANIPARPFLIPGVRKSEKTYLPHLRAAAKAALEGNTAASDKALAAAGMVAESAVKVEITTADFVPLKPSTVAARARSRGTKSRRSAEKQYLKLIASGATPADAQSAAGIRPLIDTGQLRNAVTSVVRKLKRFVPRGRVAEGPVGDAAEAIGKAAGKVASGAARTVGDVFEAL